jgi:Protein of unknown function (DUF2971)
MTDTKSPASSLPPVLRAAIEKFDQWTQQHMESEDNKNTIDTALYHYTDARGLKGIIESETIWFTDYRHLNDPSELTHGIEMARDVMNNSRGREDAHGREFLDCLADMLSTKNFSGRFEFFIASFSRDRDELSQWRAYADNGRGYAIGFAPRMFRIEEDRSDLQPNEKTFVGPVLYDIREVTERHALAIDEAIAIFLEAVYANVEVVKDETIRDHFIQQFCRDIISAPLIWNCLTSKHPAYKREKEVRLLMLNQRRNLMPYIKTRLRGSEIVPYIPHPRPIREPHIIVEIVVGPAAGPDAERTVRTMLDSFSVDPKIPIGRSDIPYRAL